MDNFELIFRFNLGGSVYPTYRKTGCVAGHTLIPDMPEWTKLDEPIFTPSTKEKTGHDINKAADDYFSVYGQEGRDFVDEVTDFISEVHDYLENLGILMMDTKIEGSSALKKIGDERCTPDSSRYCDANDWKKAMETGQKPKFLDKQFVREWGMKIITPFKDENGTEIIGINKLDPENPEHVKFVDNLEIPKEIIEETSSIYLKIFERITGMTLTDYQKEMMGVGH